MNAGGRSRQRLAAILAADVAGYSRLMTFDEESTVASLEAARSVFRMEVESHKGRVIDTAGDSVLAVFETAAGGVTAALEIQRQLDGLASEVTAEFRLLFRIGVHLGDITEKADGTAYGDGVNIAARLQSLAEPSGVVISDAVHGAVRNRVVASFEDLGKQQLKNILHPVRVYRVVQSPERVATGRAKRHEIVGRLFGGMRRWLLLVSGLGLVLVGTLAVYERGTFWQRADGLVSNKSVPATPIAMSLTVGEIASAGATALPAGTADAYREDLINGIASVERHVRLMTVTREQSPALGERARRSGVRYLVEGDMRANGTRQTINLRLVETDRGKHVWSKSFDLPEAAASFESAVTRRRIVREIAAGIAAAETLRVMAKPIDQLDAMELVVRARSIADSGPPLPSAIEMRRLADQALLLDPSLAPAVSTALDAVDRAYDLDPEADRDQYAADMDQYSSRGVALDANSAGAWISRAAALQLRGQWNASLEAGQRGIQLDPFSGWVYLHQAFLLNMMGRPADALPLTEKALLLGEAEGWALNVACESHVLLREFEKAITSCERAIGVHSRNFADYAFLAAAYANAGDSERARVALKALLNIVPGYTIAKLKAKRYSDHPDYLKLAEATWYAGLRKAGLPD